MPNYRRFTEPGAIYFFTLVTSHRRPIFKSDEARTILGDCIRDCQKNRPFQVDGIVLLPDHLHALWTLPHGDSNYSQRWSQIKSEFTRRWLGHGGKEVRVSSAQNRERRRGVWQPRFWEHMITDEEDFERHLDYIHYNPVKHGYARCPCMWAASSFHACVRRGVYDINWGCGSDEPPRDFRGIQDLTGE